MFTRLSVLAKFLTLAGIFFVVLASALILASNIFIKNSFINRSTFAVSSAVVLEARNLQPENFSLNNPQRTKYIFDNFYKNIKTAEIIRIKVWDDSGKVIFSDDNSIIGKQFPDNEEFTEAIKGEVVTEIGQKVKPENITEKGYEQLLEVYVPITLQGNPVPYGVIETYFKLDDVNTRIKETQVILFLTIASFTLASFVLLFIVFKMVVFKQIERINLQGSALEATANGVVITDTKGIMQWVNPAYTTLTGYTFEEAIGKSTKILRSGKQDALFYQNLWDTISSGKVWHGEIINRKKDGSLYTEEQIITPVKDSSGKIIRYIAIKQDISDRKNFEGKLAARTIALEEASKFQKQTRTAMMNIMQDLESARAKMALENVKDEAILASIGDGIIATGKDGNIILMNHAAEVLLKTKTDEFIGKQLDKVLHAYDEKGYGVSFDKQPMQIAMATGTTTTTTTTYYYGRSDGTKFPVAITVTPILLNNNVQGAVEIFRDITKEKEMNRLKDEFVSIASHELRTPLTAIDGLVSMILDGEYGEVNKNLKQPLEDVNTSSERLIHLVNDLLNISRLTAGRLAFKVADISLGGLLGEIATQLDPIAVQKGIALKIVGITDATVQIDPDRAKQILDNILGNALKFTDKGSITVSSKALEESMVIYISDTGIGMTDQDKVKLFGKFEQLESGKGRIGTGLGLYLSKEIARKMGGDVWLESTEPAKGSTFAFSIPKSESELAKKVKDEIEREKKLQATQESVKQDNKNS